MPGNQVENYRINKDRKRLEKISQILNRGKNRPEVRVKIEKQDKGLFERTSNSTVLLTEDNKMMLTD